MPCNFAYTCDETSMPFCLPFPARANSAHSGFLLAPQRPVSSRLLIGGICPWVSAILRAGCLLLKVNAQPFLLHSALFNVSFDTYSRRMLLYVALQTQGSICQVYEQKTVCCVRVDYLSNSNPNGVSFAKYYYFWTCWHFYRATTLHRFERNGTTGRFPEFTGIRMRS